MKLREERRNDLQEQEQQISEQMTGISVVSDRAKRDLEELKKLNPSTRAEILNNLDTVATNLLIKN
ncbi:MAG: hypothetical protein K6G30_07380 [Acetatifactor sp.]|nr:hypothetical protein [Acetatifactor sp.]